MVVTEGLFEQAWTYPDMLVGFSLGEVGLRRALRCDERLAMVWRRLSYLLP